MPCGWRRLKASLLLAAGLGALLAGCREAARPTLVRRLALAPGAYRETALAAGASHLYLFALPAGRYADLAVDQRGVDVAVTLSGPDGKRLSFVDGPYFDQGAELIPLVSETAGTYRLEVRTSSDRGNRASPGRYAILVRALRPATRADRTRVAAERAWARGEELRGRGNRTAVLAALAEDERALGLFAGLGDPARQADTLASLGWAQSALGEEAAARGLFESALALFRGQGRERETGEVLNDLGKAHRRLGEPRRALACYREALALNHRLGEAQWEAISWNGLGTAHEALGETEPALAAYEEALVLFHRLGRRTEEGVALANRGRLEREMGQIGRALDDLGRSLPLLRGSAAEADALADYGVALSRQRQDGAGLPALARALALHRRAGDRRGEATVRNDLGWLHFWLRDREAARRDYEAAAAAYRALGDARDEALAETNLAWLDVDRGRPAEALSRLDRALPALAAAEDADGEADALLARARARRAQGDLPGARQAMTAALDRVEALRRAPASHQMRATFLASRQDFYRFDVDLWMMQDRQSPRAGFAERAFAASEEGRARSLLELLAEAGVDLRRGVDPQLLAWAAELGRQLNAADVERRRTATAATEREVANLLDLYDRAQARIRLASPRYAALALPRPLGVPEAARLLDRDTLLLEYALGDERSFLWVVAADGLALSFELPAERILDAAARRAAGLLAESRQPLAEAETGHALAELSQYLLKDAAPRLAGKRLVVVADGALHALPFAALPDPANGGAPLLAGHEVVSLPSASALAVQRRELAGRPLAPGTVAVVADPVFDAADPRVAPPRPAHAAAGAYPRLPFSRQEAEAILALAPPRGRLGVLDFDARRETVLSGALSRYRIVHFATHAELDSSHPDLYGIVLSQVDAQGRPRDGILRAHEIYQLHLPAELVVLSACRTALGRELRGEGLVGLTRGFQYPGARRVLVSLWPVEDQATAELMRRFYQGLLAERLPPAAALRAAQLAVRHLKGREAPYYWAGFVLEGDWIAN